MKYRGKILIKTCAFIIILILLFQLLNIFLKQDWNAGALDIYEEPKDTMETVFIGTSMIEFGIDVMTLYEEYGICAYNLGSSGQPVPESYYWLKEVYKTQSESLKTVVFDVSLVRTKLPTPFYRRATENMKFSMTKYEAVDAYANGFNETVSYMFPLFSYHTRWDELTSDDFGISNSMLYTWSRGQCFSTDTPFAVLKEDELIVPDYTLDKDAQPSVLDDEGLEYLDKMNAFCKEKGLELILIKTPNPVTWSSGDHNAFEALAKEKNLEFLDFNYAPLINEIDYDCMFDSMDGVHLNYYGAEKFALWMGNYLIENGYAHDIRGDEKYAFLEDDLKEHKDTVEHLVAMRECMNPVDYLQLASQRDDYTVFITVKTDAEKSLTDEQKEGFSELGLKEISKLERGASYIAVIDSGQIIYEMSETLKTSKAKEPLIYKGELRTGELYTLKSGGKDLGNIAKCVIEGKDYANNTKGLNIVVYDNTRNTVIDKAVFDTNKYCEREVPVAPILQAKLEELKDSEQVPITLKKYVEYKKLLEVTED